MTEVTIRKINFGSFVKLGLFLFSSMGVALGILMFVLSLLGGNVKANLGTTELTGIAAGLTSIIMSPIIMGIIGIVFFTLAYLPFRIIVGLFDGINIKGDFN